MGSTLIDSENNADARTAFVDAVDQSMQQLLTNSARGGTDVVEAALDAVCAGGKRLRPLLVLAADCNSNPESANWRQLVSAATAIEMVHTATLIHDDVIDQSALRRGVPTAWKKYDTAIAVAAGDLLFARAFTALVDLENQRGVERQKIVESIRILAHAGKGLAEGEALQASQRWNFTVTINQYLERCRSKTGILFGAATRMGALHSRFSAPEQLEIFERWGLQIGTAFQMADDLLDILPENLQGQVGKPVGADLDNGHLTLPVLYARDAMDDFSAIIESACISRSVTPDQKQQVNDLLLHNDIFTNARELVINMVDRQELLLEHLSETDQSFSPTLMQRAARMCVERMS